MAKKVKVIYRKYGGDGAYDYAVFVDDRPVMTGLNRKMAQYETNKLKIKYK